MGDLDARTVIDVGGWDGRFAVVLAVRTLGERGAAVIDANGDGADIDLEHFRRDDGEWRLVSSSGGAGDGGLGWYDGMRSEHGRDESGWWLTLEPGAAPDEDQVHLPDGTDHGWVAWVDDPTGGSAS